MSNINQERKSTFDHFQKAVQRVFLINYDEPLNKQISKLKCILYTLYITQFKDTKYFLLHAVWREDRAIQLLKFSMSQEVEKGPFAVLTFESSKNVILTYFQKLMWFYLLVTKDSLLSKIWGKLFFMMRNALDCSYRDRHLIMVIGPIGV